MLLPSPHILALIATLTVHPTITTRSTSLESQETADLAVAFLHHAINLVGPCSPSFRKAFRFSAAPLATTCLNDPFKQASNRQSIKLEEGEKSLRGKDVHPKDASGSEDSLLVIGEEAGQDDEMIKLKIAQGGGLFARAESFWHTVGWAFNCSVRHAHRWARWKLWLRLMVEILERDWKERLHQAQSRNHGDLLACTGAEELRGSMALLYISDDCKYKTSGQKKIMRAVLADGGSKAMAEFKEVFEKECDIKRKGRDEEAHISRNNAGKRKLDVDGGEFGDYYEEEEQEQEEPKERDQKLASAKRESGRVKSKKDHAGYASWNRDGTLEIAAPQELAKPDPETIEDFGGMEAMILRRRLLALVRLPLQLSISLIKFCS